MAWRGRRSLKDSCWERMTCLFSVKKGQGGKSLMQSESVSWFVVLLKSEKVCIYPF